ncbi:EAL domain-containing protein [Hahella sp. KA22]|uniref:sensor domain-containing protein n=1 Tax=Hahella sp. KA22 TaxID=1628392 RepID=UPI0013E31A78|nr:EAL domain-containing protein [Hahella sp. KA22]
MSLIHLKSHIRSYFRRLLVFSLLGAGLLSTVFLWADYQLMETLPAAQKAELSLQSCVLYLLTACVVLIGAVVAWMLTSNEARNEALRESRNNLDKAQQIARLGNWLWDLKRNEVYWSDQVYRNLGLSLHDNTASYEKFLGCVHPDDRARVVKLVDDALENKQVYALEHRVIWPSGEERIMCGAGEVIFDAQGHPVQMHGTIQDITERKLDENRKNEYAHLIYDLYNNAPCGYHSLDPQGVIVDINETALRWLGYSRNELVGKAMFCDLLSEDCVQLCWDKLGQLKKGGALSNLELNVRCKDGRLFCVLLSSTALQSEDGEFRGSRCILVDYTERRRHEKELQQAAVVFDAIREAVIITDDARNIVAVNNAFTEITGYTLEDVYGRNPRLQQSGRHDKTFYQSLWRSITEHGHWQGEIENKRRNGEIYPAWQNINVVYDRNGNIANYVSVFSDISVIKEKEKQLRHLANHDSLTGLPNRLLFFNSLEISLERAKRRRMKVALMFIDLDRFKIINDTMGHEAGDILLKTVARRLSEAVRGEDMVARLGGDEFTISLEELSNTEDAAAMAGKLIETIRQPIHIGGHEIVCSASIGIAIFPHDADSAQNLARAADAAMYRAKELHRNTFEFYTSELTERAIEHLTLSSEMRQALERNEFELYYQPQFNLASGKLVGAETLLRWRHPTRGLITPYCFINIAEDSALIDPIGRWVINQLCRDVAGWLKEGLKLPRIAFNVSGKQLEHYDVKGHIEHALQRWGLEPSDLDLELEVTEGALQHEEHSVEVLRQVRTLGLSVAIDDFGTGYSSLSRLKRMPIDTLKIDRMFIRDLPEDPNNQALASGIILLGRALGLKVVAEGVENVEQLRFLQERDCDEVQGFLLSKPLPKAAFVKLLKGEGLPAIPLASLTVVRKPAASD